MIVIIKTISPKDKLLRSFLEAVFEYALSPDLGKTKAVLERHVPGIYHTDINNDPVKLRKEKQRVKDILRNLKNGEERYFDTLFQILETHLDLKLIYFEKLIDRWKSFN